MAGQRGFAHLELLRNLALRRPRDERMLDLGAVRMVTNGVRHAQLLRVPFRLVRWPTHCTHNSLSRNRKV
jgi:hypothetical protein